MWKDGPSEKGSIQFFSMRLIHSEFISCGVCRIVGKGSIQSEWYRLYHFKEAMVYLVSLQYCQLFIEYFAIAVFIHILGCISFYTFYKH